MTLEQWQQIVHRFQNTRFYLPLMIGFYTNLSLREIFALTWDDIDFTQRTLIIRKLVKSQSFPIQLSKKERQKSALFGVLQLPKQTRFQNRLLAWYSLPDFKSIKMSFVLFLFQNIAAVHPINRLDMLCVSEDGQYTSMNSFQYCFRIIRRELKISCSFRTLHRTCIALLKKDS